jgi:transposase-like protein
MVRRERKFYTEEFKERVLAAYYNSNESVSMVYSRFQVSRDNGQQLGLPEKESQRFKKRVN